MSSQKTTLANALEQLEQIVQQLNANDLDVEVGLVEFKKGVELVEFCRAELKKAENQFVELKARLDKTSVEEEENAA